MLSPDQKAQWERDGFFIARGFETPARCSALLARAIEIAKRSRVLRG
jgi:hypothetical protein